MQESVEEEPAENEVITDQLCWCCFSCWINAVSTCRPFMRTLKNQITCGLTQIVLGTLLNVGLIWGPWKHRVRRKAFEPKSTTRAQLCAVLVGSNGFACLLAKLHVNHWMDWPETFRKWLLGVYLLLINLWRQLDSTWLPQLINSGKHKKTYKSVIFAYYELKFGLILAKNHLQNVLYKG